VVGHRVNRHSLLEKSVEELSPVSGCSPVEPERELVEIVVEVFLADRAMMRAEEPALEE
jgi:hypothetical protein